MIWARHAIDEGYVLYSVGDLGSNCWPATPVLALIKPQILSVRLTGLGKHMFTVRHLCLHCSRPEAFKICKRDQNLVCSQCQQRWVQLEDVRVRPENFRETMFTFDRIYGDYMAPLEAAGEAAIVAGVVKKIHEKVS